jgi:hypothetical protein
MVPSTVRARCRRFSFHVGGGRADLERRLTDHHLNPAPTRAARATSPLTVALAFTIFAFTATPW